MNEPKNLTAIGIILLLAVSLSLGSYMLVSAQTAEDPELDESTVLPVHRRGFGPLSMLTEEQRAEVMTTIHAMREAETSPEEIKAYVDGYLEELGIEFEPPEAPFSDLTEEERALHRQLREEVREFAKSRAEELGIELPPGAYSGPRAKNRGPMRPHREQDSE